MERRETLAKTEPSLTRPSDDAPKADRNFLIRAAAAAVMAPAGLWAVYAGGDVLFWATTACALIAALEWTRMAMGPEHRILRPVVAGVLCAGAVGAVANAQAPGAVGIIAVLTALLAGGAAAAARRFPASIAFGGFYLTFPFAAFVWIRESAPEGREILICVLALVFVTDIGAYLAGRGFGGPRLAPWGSPNKTWAGALGGLLCAGLVAVACGRLLGGGLLAWIAAGLAISIVSQAGDLLESVFKRHFGVKDASGVIPGHGGMLDRLDGLMAA
ncbi:MAG: phosphatidate cytidylyltransferase, partial [Pseudomonadota bacterium]